MSFNFVVIAFLFKKNVLLPGFYFFMFCQPWAFAYTFTLLVGGGGILYYIAGILRYSQCGIWRVQLRSGITCHIFAYSHMF